ncbi:MAG: hypothetical protein RR502_09710 [Oscillospiraceae bacterium]
MKNKLLHNRRGTTLLEVLFAFLIFAMSAVMFAQQVTTAAMLNRQASEGQTALTEEVSAAETMLPINQIGGREMLTVYAPIPSGGESYIARIPVQRYSLMATDKLSSYKSLS